MLLKLTNRMVGDLRTRVFDPLTGQPFDENAVINTDNYEFLEYLYFDRVLREGDLEETKPIKQITTLSEKES
jgi:hypothetical protein